MKTRGGARPPAGAVSRATVILFSLASFGFILRIKMRGNYLNVLIMAMNFHFYFPCLSGLVLSRAPHVLLKDF